MKIALTHRLFKEDPYIAFAQRHNTTPKMWYEMYNNRYLWHQYEIPILAEYFKLKTNIEIHERTIRRWIKRTEIYNKAQFAINKGVKEVSHEYFEKYATLIELEEMLK